LDVVKVFASVRDREEQWSLTGLQNLKGSPLLALATQGKTVPRVGV